MINSLTVRGLFVADAPLEYWDEAHTYIARKLREVCMFVAPSSGGRGGLLTHFPTFVPEFKNDKIPKFLVCVGWRSGGGEGNMG